MKKIAVFAVMIILTAVFGESAFAMADSADCACMINGTTGEVVFSKNMDEQHSMASTTKIMTAIIAIEQCDMEEKVTVSRNAAYQEGSAAYVRENNVIAMKDLLYGLMLNSGNDAAVAIAEHISGSSEAFAELMNKKAEVLGLTNTHFMNPNGLDNPEHYTTAYELAMIAKYAMENEDFREIVSTRTYQATPDNSTETLYFSNHNKMLKNYEGSTGIKTGYTRATGRCLVSSAERDNMEFIAVTLGDPNDWKDHSEMLDYAFAEHYPKQVVREGMKVKIAEIDGNKYNMVAKEDFTVPLKERGKTEIEVVTHIAENLDAPINEGEKIGYLDILCNGQSAGRVDVVSESDIGNIDKMQLKNSFLERLTGVFRNLLN